MPAPQLHNIHRLRVCCAQHPGRPLAKRRRQALDEASIPAPPYQLPAELACRSKVPCSTEFWARDHDQALALGINGSLRYLCCVCCNWLQWLDAKLSLLITTPCIVRQSLGTCSDTHSPAQSLCALTRSWLWHTSLRCSLPR